MRHSIFASAAALLAASPAFAHPGAAPWKATGSPGAETCATCHFEAEPARGSNQLYLSGLPGKIEAGKSYEIELALTDAKMKIAGFLAAASAGRFEAPSEAVELSPDRSAIRSTLAAARQTGTARWTFRWRAPDTITGELAFYLSANAGNDDQSPFGDQIYLDIVKP